MNEPVAGADDSGEMNDAMSHMPWQDMSGVC